MGDIALLWLGIAVGSGVTAVFLSVMMLARAGGIARASWGLTVGGRASQDPTFAAKVDELMGGASAPIAAPKPSPTVSQKPSGEPLRLLALLQTEARLVDFLMEDISGAADAQVGQAVRKIHDDARKVLTQYIVLEEIYPASAETVTVQKGFDPSAVRVVGNVTGEPPFTGRLEHPGWKVLEIKLPSQAQGQNPFVIQPAEVELS